MANNIIDKIQISGQSYDVKDSSAATVVELTQQEYDDLPSSAKTGNTLFVITDAQAGDLTNYYTKSETNTLLGGKADTATTYTKTETDNAITAATSTKQDTLVSSQNIKTINNESLLGSGNIDIQGGGGGKAIEAGRGISITTGETADTVSFSLPISTGRSDSLIFNVIDGGSKNVAGQNASAFGIGCNAGGYASFVIGGSNTASTYSFAGGNTSKANGNTSFAFGYMGQANGAYSVTLGGSLLRTNNQSEHASGQFNVSSKASTTFGDSGNTLFSVGNGTADNARHNAFEIRQNGDIYLTSGSTDIKLQDHLGGGGGGSSYTAGDGIDITNNVISVTGKVDTSAITTAITSSSTDSEIPSAKAVYDQMGGLKLVKLTQSAYDALSPNYDSNTLYVING